jgi:hypothetical protein
MAERGRDASMERIRAYAQEQVARTSLRKVSDRAKVKLGATKKFVDGSEPYERNARLWKKWYDRELLEGRAGGADDALAAEDARIALELLLLGIPEEERDAAIRRAAALIRGLFQSLGHTAPQWTTDLTGDP